MHRKLGTLEYKRALDNILKRQGTSQIWVYYYNLFGRKFKSIVTDEQTKLKVPKKFALPSMRKKMLRMLRRFSGERWRFCHLANRLLRHDPAGSYGRAKQEEFHKFIHSNYPRLVKQYKLKRDLRRTYIRLYKKLVLRFWEDIAKIDHFVKQTEKIETVLFPHLDEIRATKDKTKRMKLWRNLFAGFEGDLSLFELLSVLASMDYSTKSSSDKSRYMQGQYVSYKIQSRKCNFRWSQKGDILYRVGDVVRSWEH